MKSKEKIVSVNFSHALLSTHDNLAMQALVWLCMGQFRTIQFGVFWFSVHTWISNDLAYLSTKFKEETSSCIGINTVLVKMSVELVIKHLDFCSILLWWTGHSVSFLNVFCVLFYGDFPNFCPCLNGRVCKMLISGHCWPSCMLFTSLRNYELYHTLPQKHCKWVSVLHALYICFHFSSLCNLFFADDVESTGHIAWSISFTSANDYRHYATDIHTRWCARFLQGLCCFFMYLCSKLCSVVGFLWSVSR